MSARGASLLLVDDDIETIRALRRILTTRGYKVFTAKSGEEAVTVYAQHRLDLVLLELALPGMSGIDLCRHIRADSTLPLLILSANDAEQDKVDAFTQGADDYILKPFSMSEVLARVQAALRRADYGQAGQDVRIHLGSLLIDPSSRRVFVREREVSLTPKEYDLLHVFITQRDTILTRPMLLKQVWRTEGEAKAHSLHVHIAQLRRKIEPDPEHPHFIHTLPGVGYRFTDDPEESGGAEEKP